MQCWICGAEASTREHIVKASDLREEFGLVTQSAPIYYTDSSVRNRKVGSVNSDRLKYSAKICEECNSSRTQQHDLAWQTLSKSLRERDPPIRAGTIVKLEKIFPGTTKQSMLGVHLFFIKHFGCLIAEHSVRINLIPLSDAVLTNKPHPHIYLAFWCNRSGHTRKHVGRTPIHAVDRGNVTEFANWFYFVGAIGVNVIYAPPPHRSRHLGYVWHPSFPTKRLRITDEA